MMGRWKLPATPSGAVHFLHPGDVVCAEGGDRLETLLGSCVAVILTDRARTFGAMCHIVHCGSSKGDPTDTAYSDAAIDTLYSEVLKRGLTPRLCEAFVYGGGNMFPDVFKTHHVGEDNGWWVLDRLDNDEIGISLHDLGGSVYRRLSWVIGAELPQVTAVSV